MSIYKVELANAPIADLYLKARDAREAIELATSFMDATGVVGASIISVNHFRSI